MYTKQQIKDYLKKVDSILCEKNTKGEICLYGGTVMCIVFNARPSTKDVDAIFYPSNIIKDAANQIAEEFNLRKDWLNDGVKGFLVKHEKYVYYDWPSLKVYIPEPDYLLAMKTLASRVDTSDRNDICFLIDKLELKKPEEVFKIIERYYPKSIIKPATQYFIEEIFENDKSNRTQK